MPGQAAIERASAPFLARGETLTARRALALMRRLRARPGEEVWVSEGDRSRVGALRRQLGPDVLVRSEAVHADAVEYGPRRVYARARVQGEPVAKPGGNGGADATGQWLTVAAAARRAGVSTEWFTRRYVRSGLVPRHLYGARHFVRKVDVDRARRMRAGGAIFAADWPDDQPAEFDDTDRDYLADRAIEAARERIARHNADQGRR